MKLEIFSNAKINIGLNIEEKLENGYHNLDMTMLPINLSDKMNIEFFEKKGKLKIFVNNPKVPTDEKNILSKVYNKFYELAGLEPEEIEIYLDKKIPLEAGLGGGSSNGGFFLKELNKFHKMIFTDEELMEKFKNIGADIPFFIKNKSCRARGIGEKLDFFQNNLDVSLLLIKPEFGVSTVEAFINYEKENLKKSIKDEKKLKKSNISQIIKGIEENKMYIVVTNIENQLEQALLINNPQIQEFRKKIMDLTHHNFFMSGSGSCYYLLIKNAEIKEVEAELKIKLPKCDFYICDFL